jgi:hypothetical protein
MHIKFIGTKSLNSAHVEYWIKYILETSRFTANVSTDDTSRRDVVKIDTVRLKTSKAYCGNHPNACENGGTREEEQPHRRSRYLEGADWVEFNDLINDLLDALELDGRFESALLIMRKGRERRTHYGSTRIGRQFQWNKDEDSDEYQDFCGKLAPDSTFPDGTPGIYKNSYSEIG